MALVAVLYGHVTTVELGIVFLSSNLQKSIVSVLLLQ